MALTALVLGAAVASTVWLWPIRGVAWLAIWAVASAAAGTACVGMLFILVALRSGSERVRDALAVAFVYGMLLGAALLSVPLLSAALERHHVRAAQAWCEARVTAIDAHVRAHGFAPALLPDTEDTSDAPRFVREGCVRYEASGRVFTFTIEARAVGVHTTWSSWNRGWAVDRL